MILSLSSKANQPTCESLFASFTHAKQLQIGETNHESMETITGPKRWLWRAVSAVHLGYKLCYYAVLPALGLPSCRTGD